MKTSRMLRRCSAGGVKQHIGIAAGLLVLWIGQAAADTFLLGSDLLTFPGVSFPNGTPTQVGSSIVFDPGNASDKLMVLPLAPAGSAPTIVMMSINLTRLSCIGVCSEGDVDSDPNLVLTDGSLLAGVMVANNENGQGFFVRFDDAGLVATNRQVALLFSNAGYPAIGESFEIELRYMLNNTFDGTVAYGSNSAQYSSAEALDRSQPISFVLLRDNEGGEQYQVNSLAFSVRPVSIPVAIDIKPGSFPNSINLKSKGVVPVAVLSSQDFNPVGVIVDTVLFAGASPEKFAYKDTNSDGVADLILHFRTQELVELTSSSTEATLTGELRDGGSITGTDSVQMVPRKDKEGKKEGKGDKDKE